MTAPVNPMNLRIGLGYDFHVFSEKGRIVLGGVTIDDCPALKGHSDADVLTHAVMDALLGAAGEVDIGTLFPNTDETYHGASSTELARQVVRLVREKGFEIVSLDTVLICDKPIISAWRNRIRAGIAGTLALEVNRVNVKGKTNEGYLGRGPGVEAQATALLWYKG